ncbi:hypothetical protein ACKWRH_03650 [Bradyrhizobium sp. Pa8]|uniref:hypothetical protein n=1 Tax=Bradyrhizobium sp. Pa8 TaxID=3386552 RepID=UPI00403F8483
MATPKPNSVQESLDFIIAHMATKIEIEEFRAETSRNFQELRSEIADVHRSLDVLRAKVENIEGYRIEIDHALERIATIERHLGIRSKLAA